MTWPFSSPGLAASVIGVMSSLSSRGGDSYKGVLSRINLGGVGSLTEALLTTTLGGGWEGGVSGTEMYDDKRSPDCLPIMLTFSSGQSSLILTFGYFSLHFTFLPMLTVLGEAGDLSV